jgi:hypothetical protein
MTCLIKLKRPVTLSLSKGSVQRPSPTSLRQAQTDRPIAVVFHNNIYPEFYDTETIIYNKLIPKLH